MHLALHLFVTGATSALVSAAVLTASPNPAPDVSATAPGPDDSAALRQLMQRVDALQGDLEARPLLGGQATGTVSARRALDATGDLPAAIEAAVRDLVAPEALQSPQPPAPTWPGDAATAAEAAAQIAAVGPTSEAGAALLAEAAANGQLHELLTAMEERWAGLPDGVDKELDRGQSYYAAARAFPNNVDGNWWVDSDNAYAAALEHDPMNWDARYEKARNQSFWPTAYGGQAEAIRHFEVLAEQQEVRAPEGRFAQTYVWLGNLYDQQGRAADARAAWERGLALYPSHDGLRRKLASLGR